MRGLLSPELRAAEPRLNGLDRLVTRWMNGIMLLPARRPAAGPRPRDLPRLRVGADVDLPAPVLARRRRCRSAASCRSTSPNGSAPGGSTGRSPALCTPEEIRDEVWAQFRAHLDERWTASRCASWFLDEAIEFPNPSGATNAEPLLVNTKGSWADRPDASTAIPNLMLAADYVRTYTDLATMEGANEAARRAVNAILDASARARRGATCGRCASRRRWRPARTLDQRALAAAPAAGADADPGLGGRGR